MASPAAHNHGYLPLQLSNGKLGRHIEPIFRHKFTAKLLNLNVINKQQSVPSLRGDLGDRLTGHNIQVETVHFLEENERACRFDCHIIRIKIRIRKGHAITMAFNGFQPVLTDLNCSPYI